MSNQDIGVKKVSRPTSKAGKSAVYMVSKLVYPKCTQEEILPKVATSRTFLVETTLP